MEGFTGKIDKMKRSKTQQNSYKVTMFGKRVQTVLQSIKKCKNVYRNFLTTDNVTVQK